MEGEDRKPSPRLTLLYYGSFLHPTPHNVDLVVFSSPVFPVECLIVPKGQLPGPQYMDYGCA
mgnify:CR=1 FL=1